MINSVLAIDHGTVRIGLAIARSPMFLGLPLDSIIEKTESAVFDTLKKIIQTYQADHILVGLPLNMQSADSAQTEKARLFAEKLKNETGIPVELVDERLTSKIAIAQMHGSHMEMKNMKQHKDSLSALVMLEAWLRSNLVASNQVIK